MSDTPAGFGRYIARIVLMLVVLLVLGAAAWTWLTLSWAYSVGERAGVLQKFSEKGWICKTYEGEIAQVHYREHRGIPTNCFGDTPYFAESVTVVPPTAR